MLYVSAAVALAGIVCGLFVQPASELAMFVSLTLIINGPYSPLLPAGYEPVVMTYGQLYAPLLIAAIGVAGQLAVEYVNYRLYDAALHSSTLQRLRSGRLARWMVAAFNASPFAAVAVTAFLPLPFWVVRIAAPLARYPMRRYLTAMAIGRVPRLWFYAALGTIVPLSGTTILLAGLIGGVILAIPIALQGRVGRAPAHVPVVAGTMET